MGPVAAHDEDSRTPEVAARPTRRLPWWPVLSWILAAVLFAVAFSLLRATTGVGGIVTGLVLAFGVTWARVWRRGIPRRKQLWTAVAALVLVGLVWDGITFTRYVTKENGDNTGQRMTTWARNHGLGDIIDWMERVVYNDPPSKEPADELSLDIRPTTTTTAPPEVVTSTTIAPPADPEPLVPNFSPLPGEGQWTAVMQANGMNAIWATSIRPLPDTGGVVATVLVIDQTYLRVGLFNGSEQPGGDWARDDKVPPELWPALVGAMNSGFRLESAYGGYVTEGKVVQELELGRATLAIDKAGTLHLGELGRDIFDDGSWLSMRQNLVLMVDGGESGIGRGDREQVYWGAHSSGETYVNRSAICTLADGRLGYVVAGPVNAEQLAQVLIHVGCITGIQLDINDGWPNFTVFPHGEDGTLQPYTLDRRMDSDPMRFINGATRDFFAFFDSTKVPAASVLDR